MGVFTEEAEIISRIKYKYKYNYEKGLDQVKRKVNSVKSILIDTEPGAVIKIKTNKMTDFERIVINHTG
jgi:hypothetical protein